MTEEEKEAIERLNRIITTKFNNDYSIDSLDKEAIETVLNMLKENSAEIEQKNTELAEKSAEIEKKNKIIDLMTGAIYNYDDQLEINTFRDKEHIKEYFKELAEQQKGRNNGYI